MNSSAPTSLGRHRGRPPSIAVRSAIEEAARQVMVDDGLDGFSFSTVAHKAGSSRATLYRHWDSPEELLLDALEETIRPDTSSASGDLVHRLISLAVRRRATLSDSLFLAAMPLLAGLAAGNSTLAPAARTHFSSAGRGAFMEFYADQIGNGTARSGWDAGLLVDMIEGAVLARVLSGRPVTDAVIDHMAHYLGAGFQRRRL